MQPNENGQPQFQNDPLTSDGVSEGVRQENIVQPSNQDLIQQIQPSVSAESSIDVADNSNELPSTNVSNISQLPIQQTTTQPLQQTQEVPQSARPDFETSVSQSISMPKKRNKKWLLVVAVVIPLVFASVAAGYVGVIVPNRPENLLKVAIANTLLEENVNAEGTIDFESIDPTNANTVSATSVNFDVKSNTSQKKISAKFDLAISGVKFDAEARYVDQAAYLKLGDLTTVSQVADSYMPGVAGLIGDLSNQWIEFDKTLLKQAGVACYAENLSVVSEADLKTIAEAYDKTPFITIEKVSADTVNGQSAKKFELKIDDNKAVDFWSNNVAKLSSIKKMQNCSTNQDSGIEIKDLKDGDNSPMTIWVSNNKRIVKISAASTVQDIKKQNIKGDLTAIFSYGNVTVDAPKDAKPAMQFLGEMQLEVEVNERQ